MITLVSRIYLILNKDTPEIYNHIDVEDYRNTEEILIMFIK